MNNVGTSSGHKILYIEHGRLRVFLSLHPHMLLPCRILLSSDASTRNSTLICLLSPIKLAVW